MTLKFKLNNRLTSIATYINDTTVILTDECTNNPTSTAQLLTHDDPNQLKQLIATTTRTIAAQTNFPPILAIVKDDECNTYNLRTNKHLNTFTNQQADDTPSAELPF